MDPDTSPESPLTETVNLASKYTSRASRNTSQQITRKKSGLLEYVVRASGGSLSTSAAASILIIFVILCFSLSVGIWFLAKPEPAFSPPQSVMQSAFIDGIKKTQDEARARQEKLKRDRAEQKMIQQFQQQVRKQSQQTP